MNFKFLGLSSSILKALKDAGYVTPTPIQQKAIPAILNGSDILGTSQTGTGKTAGFTLPLLQLLDENGQSNNKPRALILCPTRELATQIHKCVETYGKYLAIRSVAIFGGVSIHSQKSRLKKGLDIIVATPGRLLDLSNQNSIHLQNIGFFVLDEADRMLDMGFIKDIRKILTLLPKKRQNLMFSATFSKDIETLASQIVKKAVTINVAKKKKSLKEIKERFISVDASKKMQLIYRLINEENWFQALIFVRTKRRADNLERFLKRKKLDASAIHSDKSQSQRNKVLDGFKKNKIRIMIATDIASRGIDINELSHVVNFDLPSVPEDYVHRIGRTGRAGASGTAVSFVTSEDKKTLEAIDRYRKNKSVLESAPECEPESQNKEHKVRPPEQKRRKRKIKKDTQKKNKQKSK